MLSSGSSPLTVVRGSMWALLMFAGVAWLAVGWSVLRLEPADVASVIGPVLLFAAVCEGIRALTVTRVWWLNAGLAVLFGLTAAVTLVDRDSSFATPSALLGWYLLVRGAVDVAVGTLTRGSDKIWGLVVALGVAEVGLGYFATSSLSRAADPVILVLGGLAVLRGVADLVTALRLRELTPARQDVLELPPERAAGVSGYSAGLSDFESKPPSRPRHRARETGPATPETFHERVVRTTKDLDAMLAQAGITGPRPGAVDRTPKDLPAAPDTPEGVALEAAKDRTAGGR